MLRRQLARLIATTVSVLTLFGAFSLGVAGRQEKTKTQPRAGESAKGQQKVVPLTSTQAGR